MLDHAPITATDLRADMLRHLAYGIGKDEGHAVLADWRMALSLAVRDRIVDPWFAATRRTYGEGRKRVYYLSMEFLIGRLLEDSVVNLGLEAVAAEALASVGQDWRAVMADEPEAALGNGGLGRLAACYMESMASLGVPATGYGLRYEHGLFRQSFAQGRQIETAETWLTQRNPWEFERPEAAWEIGFGGEVHWRDGRATWLPSESVMAAAYDMPVIGWGGAWANTLRLWSGKPVQAFDLERFNRGDYLAAGADEALARTISRVLYPDDSTEAGKTLRLKQEYFFTAASVRDILRRHLSETPDLTCLPQRVAIQMNDTHPALAGPELVRLLVDDHGMAFDDAADLAGRCLHYTNHTLLPEALERWSEGLFRHVLPRHMDIVERLDDHHRRRHPARPWELSAIHHGQVGMGELAFMTSARVNGVSALHTDLMTQTVFRDLHALHPDRIVNVTNGVTPRRWLRSANAPLSALLDRSLGTGWTADLSQLSRLEPLVAEAGWRGELAAAKRANKAALSDWLRAEAGVAADPDALFDVQIKRIHEYKRQLLNLLETVALWDAMRAAPDADWTPRVKIFAGKAAPGYALAKDIIRLINDVGAVVNADASLRGRLTVAYPANYNVSMAVRIIPAADLSEQISTAGKEASGTGNMKLSLNGALTVGTLDGANVEIREHVGEAQFYLFGLTAPEVEARRAVADHAAQAIAASPEVARALELIEGGAFSPDEPDRYRHLVGVLRRGDHYLVCSDFADYWATQRRIDADFRDADDWTRRAGLTVARMGWFSSDRSIGDYMARVWDMAPA